MIKRIDHVAIAVRDLERAKHFFIECAMMYMNQLMQ